jgi:multidrug efflux pump subunit AcrA (membrane-fusion protein)
MIGFSDITRRIAARSPRTPRGRRIAAGAAIAAGSTLLSVSIFATGPRATPEPPVEKAWPVSVVAIQPAELPPTISAFGRIESSQVTSLQSDLVAPIVAVHVAEGEWVEGGTVLVELDPHEFMLSVREREADLAEQHAALASVRTEQKTLAATAEHYRSVYEVAQKKLARHRDLMAKRMIAQSLLDEAIQQASAATIDYQNHLRTLADVPNRLAEARARLDRTTTLLERARLDLEHATIKAPFSGPVLRVAASVGNHSTLGAALVEMASAEHMELRAQVPDAYVPRLRRHTDAGATVRADVRELPDVSFELSRLAGNVRSGQSGFDAFFSVRGAPSLLRGGLGRVVSVTIALPPEADVVALPVQSLYGNDRIYRVIDERLDPVTVERVGEYANAAGEYRVLVRSPDLHTGETVITTQLPKAIGGLRVAPIQS